MTGISDNFTFVLGVMNNEVKQLGYKRILNVI